MTVFIEFVVGEYPLVTLQLFVHSRDQVLDGNAPGAQRFALHVKMDGTGMRKTRAFVMEMLSLEFWCHDFDFTDAVPIGSVE